MKKIITILLVTSIIVSSLFAVGGSQITRSLNYSSQNDFAEDIPNSWSIKL